MSWLSDMPVRTVPLTAKRGFDIAASLAGLAVLSPVLVGTGVAVAATTGYPVLFRQKRPGLHGRSFRLVKFRTMANTTDSDGNLLPDELRLTRLGRFLRASSLDELPELWNVLVGDMSLVGPRPLLEKYLPLYSPRQRRRHDMPPGLTGWAQVQGRNAVDWPERFELDVWYVDHWSLSLDIAILLRTASTVLRRTGISAEGVATMREFRGSPDSVSSP